MRSFNISILLQCQLIALTAVGDVFLVKIHFSCRIDWKHCIWRSIPDDTKYCNHLLIACYLNKYLLVQILHWAAVLFNCFVAWRHRCCLHWYKLATWTAGRIRQRSTPTLINTKENPFVSALMSQKCSDMRIMMNIGFPCTSLSHCQHFNNLSCLIWYDIIVKTMNSFQRRHMTGHG